MPPPSERERIATAEERLRNLERRVDGHSGTLFGTQGGGGLNRDVQVVASELRHHIKDEAEVQDRTAVILTGSDGEGGMVADVQRLMEDRRMIVWLMRLVGALLLAVCAELAVRLAQWLTR